jgi:predicted metal-dependent RNase
MNETPADFIEFVEKSRNNTEKRPLRDHLAEEIIRQVVHGEREITDIATETKTGDVYVRFSFKKEETK